MNRLFQKKQTKVPFLFAETAPSSVHQYRDFALCYPETPFSGVYKWMTQMIDLPDLHGRSFSKEQAGAVSFYSWRQAAVLASLHIVLFLDSTQFTVSSRPALVHSILFVFSLQSGLVLI